MLVDTGFGRGDVANRAQLGRLFNSAVSPQLIASETAHAQVLALGFQPEDVRHIVATHLDLDHSGGLPDFPQAEVHLLGPELAAALSPDWRSRARYIPAHWLHGPRWVEHETRRRGMDRLPLGADPAGRRRGDPADPAPRPHARAHRRGGAPRRGLAAALRRRLLPPRRGADAAALPAGPALLPEPQPDRRQGARENQERLRELAAATATRSS